MSKNKKTITSDISKLCFYMQGSVSFNDAWELSVDQRRIMSKVIEQHYSDMNGKGNNRLI